MTGSQGIPAFPRGHMLPPGYERRFPTATGAAPQHVDAVLGSLFPREVCTATAASDPVALPPLLPGEEACIRRAVERRRREFTAGRACARRALEQLGITNHPLLMGPDRAPVWPDGVVGSITHCSGFAGAAVARRGAVRGVGVDAELGDPLDPELVDLVCTVEERIRLAQLPGLPPNGWAKVVFSAKEAVYKCLSSHTRTPLDFADVEITLVPEAGRFTTGWRTGSRAELPPGCLEGRFVVALPHVFAGAVLR